MDIIFHIWLHLKACIVPREVHRLIREFGSVKQIYLSDKEKLQNHGVSNPTILQALMDKNLKKAEQEIRRAEELGILLLAYGTEQYPSILCELADPPLLLYVLGDATVLHNRNAFCIVGTRRSTAYGMSAALGISEQLARCGMVIVSGVAMGIDSGAHRGAIRAQGKTIGIMGCGLNVDYPSENAELRDKITKHGALISEFPLDTPPLPGNFPIRNRLLSGFSLGVAVIEAGERSGALITAKYALEQGRDVYALPGNISNPMSKGTNQLIAEGASVLLSAEAILTEYILRYPSYFQIQEFIEGKEEEERKGEEPLKEYKELHKVSLSDAEKAVYKVLRKEPLHTNEIVRLSGLSVPEVQSSITMLQIKGKLKEHPGSRFSL